MRGELGAIFHARSSRGRKKRGREERRSSGPDFVNSRAVNRRFISNRDTTTQFYRSDGIVSARLRLRNCTVTEIVAARLSGLSSAQSTERTDRMQINPSRGISSAKQRATRNWYFQRRLLIDCHVDRVLHDQVHGNTSEASGEILVGIEKFLEMPAFRLRARLFHEEKENLLPERERERPAGSPRWNTRNISARAGCRPRRVVPFREFRWEKHMSNAAARNNAIWRKWHVDGLWPYGEQSWPCARAPPFLRRKRTAGWKSEISRDELLLIPPPPPDIRSANCRASFTALLCRVTAQNATCSRQTRSKGRHDSVDTWRLSIISTCTRTYIV